MTDWEIDMALYRIEWFGLYCAVVFVLIVIAWEVVMFIDENLKP